MIHWSIRKASMAIDGTWLPPPPAFIVLGYHVVRLPLLFRLSAGLLRRYSTFPYVLWIMVKEQAEQAGSAPDDEEAQCHD
jgi:hypothetical protein